MIAVLKLTTGEEIVGEVVGDVNSVTVTVKNPCVLQMVPHRSNPEQASVALIPIAMHIEGHTIPIKESHIIWMVTPVKELYSQYNSVFGAGIQLL